MRLNTLYNKNVFEAVKDIAANSINLVVTSPPYADIRKSYSGPSPHKYVEWFSPLGEQLLRVLKEDGSLIININDKCVKGERIPYVFELVVDLRAIGFKYIDTIIWVKKNGAAGSGRRRSDYFEYILHLAKSTKPFFNPDPIRTPYAPSSKKRAQSPIKDNVSNRETRNITKYKTWNLNPLGAHPKNVLYFKKDQGRDHPAAFDIELPTHFILSHSEPGGTVLDPFAGRGTTALAAQQNGRNYLGFDNKKEYLELARDTYGLNVDL